MPDEDLSGPGTHFDNKMSIVSSKFTLPWQPKGRFVPYGTYFALESL